MEDDTINVSHSLSVVSSLFSFHSFTYPNIGCLHILPRVLVAPCSDSPALPPLSDPVFAPWQNISHSRCLPLDPQTYIAPCRRFLSGPPESIPSFVPSGSLCFIAPFWTTLIDLSLPDSCPIPNQRFPYSLIGTFVDLKGLDRCNNQYALNSVREMDVLVDHITNHPVVFSESDLHGMP